MIGKILILIWKDLMVETRRPLEFLSASIFAITSASFGGYVASKYAVNEYMLQVIVGSAIILIQLFLAIFTAVMSFVREADRGTLHALRSSPISSESIFMAKLLFALMLMEALSLLALGSSAFFSGGGWKLLSSVALTILISGVYFSAVAAFASALAVYIEARTLIIPTIILALSAPYAQNAVTLLVTFKGLESLVLLSLSGLLIALIVTWLSQFIFE